MAHKINILLVEDDPNLGFLIQEHLESNGYAVKLFADGDTASAEMGSAHWHLCLLDVMLPKKDGFTLAKEIRAQNADMPIIFLTAKSLKEDRIEGLKIGVDDYITKPFSFEELVLRIQAVLRRTGVNGSTSARKAYQLGKYVFDVEAQCIRDGDSQQKLTTKEGELLHLLCEHKNDTLHREIALTKIWGEDTYFNSRSMDVFVSKLRKYLQEDERVEIRTVHGRGLSLVVRE